jgi:hypothetical protein
MRHALHTPSLKARVQAAWPAPLSAAGHPPGLGPALLCRHELLPRVAAYYTQLQALPRRVRRALRRRLGLPLATLALWLALGLLPVQAATIEVGGLCTLVDAIAAANTDTATGGCAAGSGADTIVLPAGSTQTLRRAHNDTYGPTGLPVIRSVITIAGQESTIARDSGAPEFRLLAVHSTGDLTLQETTVSGGAAHRGGGVANYGTLAVTHSTIAENLAYGDGGGVLNVGTLTVTYSTITGNSASFGVGNTGGGVRNEGTCTVTHSTITENSAYYSGGVANSGTCTVTHSTITGNHAVDAGGGVRNLGTLTVAHSTIAGNTVSFSGGGGVWNEGTLTVAHSTIAANTVFGSNLSFAGRGGGIQNDGVLTVTNSTIAANTASGRYDDGSGGGISNNGVLTVTNSTIAANTASGRYDGSSGGGVVNFGFSSFPGTLTLTRTLISGNTAPTGPEIFHSGSGTVTADSHNLFGVDGTAGVEGFRPGPTDRVPPAGVQLPDILDPTLALHGGTTQTHALVPGSPAIDAGGPVCLDAEGDPLTMDQRGKPRPVDGDGDGTAACDIGAFEFFPMVNDFVTLDPDLETTGDPTPVPSGPAGTFIITATFTHTSETPLRFPFFEVTAISGGNLLLNADEGPEGVGATLTPEVGDGVLSPGETVSVDFVIGLQTRAPFTFEVELFGEPVQ